MGLDGLLQKTNGERPEAQENKPVPNVDDCLFKQGGIWVELTVFERLYRWQPDEEYLQDQKDQEIKQV